MSPVISWKNIFLILFCFNTWKLSLEISGEMFSTRRRPPEKKTKIGCCRGNDRQRFAALVVGGPFPSAQKKEKEKKRKGKIEMNGFLSCPKWPGDEKRKEVGAPEGEGGFRLLPSAE